MIDTLRNLVRAATLAPSGHNTQPWKFSISADSIRIYPDRSRRLPIADPDDRELFISLGCALENLVIAARQAGFEPEVEYHGDGQELEFLRVRLLRDQPRLSALYDAIAARQTNRRTYDGRPIPPADLEALRHVPMEEGVSISPLAGETEIEEIIRLVEEGDRAQMRDPLFREELATWLRFNEREARRHHDGLRVCEPIPLPSPDDRSASPGFVASPCRTTRYGRGLAPQRWPPRPRLGPGIGSQTPTARATGAPSGPRWLGRLLLGVVAAPERQARTDAEKIKSSSALFLFASRYDDKASWISTGRAYERWALTATTLGIQQALVNQPCQVASVRWKLRERFLPDGRWPQLLARTGYAPSMPYAPRRPVEEVLV